MCKSDFNQPDPQPRQPRPGHHCDPLAITNYQTKHTINRLTFMELLDFNTFHPPKNAQTILPSFKILNVTLSVGWHSNGWWFISHQALPSRSLGFTHASRCVRLHAVAAELRSTWRERKGSSHPLGVFVGRVWRKHIFQPPNKKGLRVPVILFLQQNLGISTKGLKSCSGLKIIYAGKGKGEIWF